MAFPSCKRLSSAANDIRWLSIDDSKEVPILLLDIIAL